MSTIMHFPPEGDARPLTERVSQEVDALMGRYRVSQVRLGAWLGINQTDISARLRGATEWKVREIEKVAEGFGVHPAALMGGHAESPRPGGPDGGIPILDSQANGPRGAPTGEYFLLLAA